MVSAIILNYHSIDLTVKSIRCVMQAAKESAIDLEIILVDNSAPDTAKAFHKLLPDTVIIIENEKNIGFAKGNNQGIKRAKGDVILIMNNDLFVEADALKKGVDYILGDKKAGVWAPVLTFDSGKPQRSSAYFPTIRSLISEYLFSYNLNNKISIEAFGTDKPVQVDMVIGACMFIRKEVFKEAGLFDEDYFFKSEDVDLCYRIKALGYEVILDPRCQVVHLYSGSSSTGWAYDEHLHSTRKLFFKKHYPFLKAHVASWLIDTGLMARKLKHKFIS